LESEAGLRVQGQPGLHGKTLPPKKKKKKKAIHLESFFSYPLLYIIA
jgi:hypothetical protein